LIATAIGDSVYTYSAVRSTFTDLVIGRNLVSTVQNNRLIISATGGGSTTGSRALDFGTITSPAGFNLDLGTFI
jgi:hypothetical protein